MEDDLVVGGVGRVPVGVPAARFQVDLDRPALPLVTDLDHRIAEIRAGRPVPAAEIDDQHRAPVGGGEPPAELAREPRL